MSDPKPIDTAPNDGDVPLLLFCPEQGGWHTAVWFGGMWVDYLTTLEELQPTHWLPVPPDPPGVDP
jgi:hypothetical protein